MGFKNSVYVLYVFFQLTKSEILRMRLSPNKKNLVLTIVGGLETEINKYPYTAHYGTTCGAAIIHEKWALTAAHCKPYKYILVGSKLANGGKNVTVKNIYDHPGWSNVPKLHAMDYDSRLLELEEPLNFDNSNVQPIKLARPDDMADGKILTVTGWGNVEENAPPSPVLRAVQIPIANIYACQSVPVKFFEGTLTPRMFCAGDGGKDACQGDSGGPAVAEGRLYGTVSFGFGCATVGAYGAYSNIAEFRDWITSVTGLEFD